MPVPHFLDTPISNNKHLEDFREDAPIPSNVSYEGTCSDHPSLFFNKGPVRNLFTSASILGFGVHEAR